MYVFTFHCVMHVMIQSAFTKSCNQLYNLKHQFQSDILKPAPLNKQTSLSNHVSIVYRTPRRTHWQVKSKSPPSPTGSYLQVGSLQPAVHVLLPRERQLSLRWTGHGVHASGGNAPRSQCVGKVKTDWTRCWLPLGASRRLKGPRTAPNEAPGVVPGHSQQVHLQRRRWDTLKMFPSVGIL